MRSRAVASIDDDPGPVLPPSWVGSPVSLLATMLVVSLAVFGAAALVSLSRSSDVEVRSDGTVAGDRGPTADGVPTTVDHRRVVRGAFTNSGSGSDDPAAASGSNAAPEPVDEDAPPSSLLFEDGSSALPVPIPDDPALGGTGLDPRPGPVRCNSNYSGCIPDVEDVDCPDEGDGPVFATEPAVVLGSDVYKLDPDGDGRIC